jgi:ribosomal protein L22
MRKFAFVVIALLLLFSWHASAGLFDDVKKAVEQPSQVASQNTPDDKTTASGLKEALDIGTKNAVKEVSKVNGYFGNEAIKILLPEKIRKAGDLLSTVGYKKEVDDFVLSMNRAAETAAPKAVSIFADAIKHMTFDDAQKILRGGNTAATDFFKEKTRTRLFEEFKPVVTGSMDKVGVTQSYNKMTAGYAKLPFMKKEDIDLDDYVTNKSLDGLFLMVGQEEQKIRTNPAAQVTDLLKKVFGK